jgi:hypothetical protein
MKLAERRVYTKRRATENVANEKKVRFRQKMARKKLYFCLFRKPGTGVPAH